jgi:K+-sensing histidine kinase KdpD
LAQAGPLNEQQLGFVEHIKNASQTMNELVQNMLSLAQLDLKATPKYKPVEMKDLLDEMEVGIQATGGGEKSSL